MDWSCIKNETRFVTKNSTKMGTRREEKERSSERNMEKNSHKRELSNGVPFKTWTEAARTAIDRKRWKDTVKSPILQAE